MEPSAHKVSLVPKDLMSNSWLNIINETHEDDTIFFTEKSWKPILNLQLLVVQQLIITQ